MNQRPIGLIMLLITLASGAALEAQPATATTHVLPAQQLPRVYLVEDFFTIAYSTCEASDEMKAYFLSLVGIKVGTQAEDAFMRALVKARKLRFGAAGPNRFVEERGDVREVVEIKHLSSAASPPMTFEESHQQELREAVELADIYRDLLRELEEAGASTDGIESYIETEMRAGMGLASSEPFDSEHPAWAVSRAFEERLAQ
ncbi:MAG: hypothetical protein HC897_16310 [Thermoanaerobaculia bacterium]|nr:hypothetical protein [Thermoanaerobaculia bacterium]